MLFAETTTDEASLSCFGAVEPHGPADGAGADPRAEFAALLSLLREDIRLGIAQLERDLRVMAKDARDAERAIADLDDAGHTLASHAVAQSATLPLLGTLRRLMERQLLVVEKLASGAGADPAAATEVLELGTLSTGVLSELEAAFRPQPGHTEALARVVEIGAIRQHHEESNSDRLESTRRRLERFEARLMLSLRSPGSNDRRQAPRLPVRIAANLQCGDRQWCGATVDLARGGALVAVETVFERPPIGGYARLELAELGTFTARIVALSARGVHLAFTELTPQQRALLDGRLAAVVAVDAPFVNIARWAAREVEALFARGVAAEEITETALFASPAALLAGVPDEIAAAGDAALARDFLGKRLAPMQAQIAAGREEIVYAACCDRHGYLPAVSHGTAMGEDDAVVLAELGLSSGAVDDSNSGIKAARARRDHLATMPTPEIREIAVPITIDGRQWGAFRLGFRPSDPATGKPVEG